MQKVIVTEIDESYKDYLKTEKVEKFLVEKGINNVRFINQENTDPYYRLIWGQKDKVRYHILAAGGEKEQAKPYPGWFNDIQSTIDTYLGTILSFLKKDIQDLGEDKELILCWIREPEITMIENEMKICFNCNYRQNEPYYQVYSRFFLIAKEDLKIEINKQLKQIFKF